jgi:putative tryptophan/tyrosine transport system substrate-binding protein
MKVSRRQVVQGAGAVGLGLLAACGRWPGQAPRIPRLGYLGNLSPDTDRAREPFRQGLRERGYVEGENISIEYRYADGAIERLPDLAAELIQLPVDVIITGSNAGAGAAKLVTSTIPIVCTALGDPVRTGLIESFAHPGGNLTGLTTDLGSSLAGKRLELLLQAAPTIKQVALLWDVTNSPSEGRLVESQDAARAFGVAVQSFPVRDLNELDRALEAIAGKQEAIANLGSVFLMANRTRIAAFALENRLPSVYPSRQYVQAGGLMSYGPDLDDLTRRSVGYVDRILKGAKPSDLPVEQPMRFDFVINLTTANALGLAIPHHVLLQATEVIQ